jgi:cytochrome c biogenesis protein CcmG/thiol:disulfide interchange protein DsbE
VKGKEIAAVVARVVGIGALLFLLVTLVLGQGEPLEAGTKAPGIRGSLLPGSVAFDPAAKRTVPLVVNVWATWCVPCVQELPVFARAANDYAGRAAFLGLVTESPKDEAVAMMERFALPYPQVAITDATAAAWGAMSLPSTYIVLPDDSIAFSVHGAMDRKSLDQVLAPHLPPAP